MASGSPRERVGADALASLAGLVDDVVGRARAARGEAAGGGFRSRREAEVRSRRPLRRHSGSDGASGHGLSHRSGIAAKELATVPGSSSV